MDKALARRHVISCCYKLCTYGKLQSKILAYSLPVLLWVSSIKVVSVRLSEPLKVKEKYLISTIPLFGIS